MNSDIGNRRLGAAILGLLLIASLVRFYHIFQRPIGYDEGVHAYFTWQFSQTGLYAHNPARHGPLIYYITAPFYKIFEPSVLLGRAIVAGVSLTGIASLYLFRDEFEPITLISAGILLSIHPWVIHSTRIFRNDALLATFLLIVVASYHRLRNSPSEKTAVILGVSLALAIASKEIAYLALPSLLVAPIVVWHFHARYGETTLRDLCNEYVPKSLAMSLGCFVLVLALLYSNFPPSTPPWKNIIRSVLFWVDAAGGDSSGSPLFFITGIISNAPLVALGASLGIITTILRTDTSWARWHFVAWATSISAVLSLLGHQWSWTGIHIFTPLAFLVGFAATDLLTGIKRLTSGQNRLSGIWSKRAESIVIILILLCVIIAGVAPVVSVDSTLGGPTDEGKEAHLPSVLRDASAVAEASACTIQWEGDSPWPGRWMLHSVESTYHRSWEDYAYNETHIVVAWSELQSVAEQAARHYEQEGIHIYSSDKCGISMNSR